MKTVIDALSETFSLDGFVSWLAGAIPALVKALLIMACFWVLWLISRKGIDALKRKAHLDPTLAAFLGTGLKVTLLSIGLVTALGHLGVNTSSLLASLGVAGLALGFAAKDALSNIISGLFIFWDRPFVVGDLIENEGYYGRVEDITLRSTRVVTPDGKMLAIPNSTIVNTTVASYTNFPHLRLDIPITIGVGEDIGVWLQDEKSHVKALAELREKAFEALRTAAVDMPYETLALTPLEITSKSA